MKKRERDKLRRTGTAKTPPLSPARAYCTIIKYKINKLHILFLGKLEVRSATTDWCCVLEWQWLPTSCALIWRVWSAKLNTTLNLFLCFSEYIAISRVWENVIWRV